MIVGLIGMSRHGKDTVASAFINNGFKKYSFADKVKEEFCIIKNITLEELDKSKQYFRSELIEFAEGKKTKNKYYWIELIEDNILNDISEGKDIIITDIRRKEEVLTIMKIRKSLEGYDNVVLFEVNRPLENGGVFDEDLNTTQGLQYAHYHNAIDGIIVNNSTHEKLIERSEMIALSLLSNKTNI